MNTIKHLIKRLLIFPAALIFSGCSKVINVKLPTAASKLIIDASIDWTKNTTGNEQRIYLSVTTGYYNEAFRRFPAQQSRSPMTLIRFLHSIKRQRPASTYVPTLSLYGTSRRFFDYFRKVLAASGNNDSPFPTIPTQARGNIINQSNADNYPLGYFRLSEVATMNYIFK